MTVAAAARMPRRPFEPLEREFRDVVKRVLRPRRGRAAVPQGTTYGCWGGDLLPLPPPRPRNIRAHSLPTVLFVLRDISFFWGMSIKVVMGAAPLFENIRPT